MPLFGKKPAEKAKKEEKAEKKVPSVEDKYELKDILGT